jgi:glycosyltransferase involved in cell wall biosynthesis
MNKLRNKKIAIVHDSFTQFGGAERVLFQLIKMFPQADIYTSLINDEFQKEIRKKSHGRLYFSKLSNFPLAISHPSLFKPFFYHYYWESLNLNKYDLVITSSHSFCAHFVKVKNKHLCYMHTTPRFLHNEFNELSLIKKPIINKVLKPYFNSLRKKNKEKIKKIDLLIANSINVQKRIKKYYDEKSTVIYPPIKNLCANNNRKVKIEGKNYLFFSRLVKQKGISLVINTFNQNQEPLLVIGTSNQEKKWHKLAKKNIKFLGFVSDKKIARIFKNSKALIYASINEDFGMIPVEAMACGLPVIAYKDGGVKESIIDKKTGIFFKKYKEKSLNQAIKKFEKMKFNKNDCIKRAKQFNEELFERKLLQEVKHLLNNR